MSVYVVNSVDADNNFGSRCFALDQACCRVVVVPGGEWSIHPSARAGDALQIHPLGQRRSTGHPPCSAGCQQMFASATSCQSPPRSHPAKGKAPVTLSGPGLARDARDQRAYCRPLLPLRPSRGQALPTTPPPLAPADSTGLHGRPLPEPEHPDASRGQRGPRCPDPTPTPPKPPLPRRLRGLEAPVQNAAPVPGRLPGHHPLDTLATWTPWTPGGRYGLYDASMPHWTMVTCTYTLVDTLDRGNR